MTARITFLVVKIEGGPQSGPEIYKFFFGHFRGIFDYGDGSNWNFLLAALSPDLKIKRRGAKDILGEQRAREPKKKVEIEVIMTGGPTFTPRDRQTDSTPGKGQISIKLHA